MTFEWPVPGFLEGVRELCARNGTVLIFDEMITGFRFGLRGLQHRFGVTPDLATFGKSMANGFSVAALVGRRDIMDLGGIRHERPRVFLLSTTHGGETHELAAAFATVAELSERGAAEHIWEIGAQLTSGFDTLATEIGIASQARAVGAPCSPSIVFTDRAGADSPELRTLFMQELVTRGVLMPYLAPSLSHTSEDVAATLEAVGEALAVVKVAIDDGVRALLKGPAVRPVFRRFN
jgi:glutamate-1-semialdehyde 2,1-aminomutase